MHANDLTAAWVQARLHAANQLPTGTSITAIDVHPVGTGQVADSYRISRPIPTPGEGRRASSPRSPRTARKAAPPAAAN